MKRLFNEARRRRRAKKESTVVEAPEDESEGRVPGETVDSILARLEEVYPDMSEAGRMTIAKAAASLMTFDEYQDVVSDVLDDEGIEDEAHDFLVNNWENVMPEEE